jgi:hypothetical protein
MRAFRAIDKKLAEDNASARLVEPAGAKLIEFPGRRRFNQPMFGPFNQAGEIDGVPIVVGGQGDPVPVHLEEANGNVHICYAKRDVAADIALHMFKKTLRAQGLGRWCREKDGKWVLVKFTIHDFKELTVRPLGEAVNRLRAIGVWDLPDPPAKQIPIEYPPSPEEAKGQGT